MSFYLTSIFLTKIQAYLLTNIIVFVLFLTQIEEVPVYGCSRGLGHTQHEDSRRTGVLITLKVNVLGLHFLLLPHAVPAQLLTLQ